MRAFRWILPALASATLVSEAGVARTPAGGAAAQVTINPLLPGGPDPWIVREGDTYYLSLIHI